MLEAEFTTKRGQFTIKIQLEVDQEILVLWGPSGAGKTTILQSLAGLLKPAAGFIKLNGHTLFSSSEGINLPPRSRKIGYVFQDYALFPHMTVRQNVCYGIKSGGKKRKKLDPLELLQSFGIGYLVDRFPAQISGGEKQRVALARALAAQPELLLLDEPLSALDKDTRSTLRHKLKKIHREWQTPFIVVTHDEEDALFLGDSRLCLTKKTPLVGAVAR